MRLIDADALKARLDYCTTKGMGSTIAFTFKHMIDEQPIVEPKRGEWRLWDGPNWYRCSECGAVRRQISFMENYCPNCGARMVRGEKDEVN